VAKDCVSSGPAMVAAVAGAGAVAGGYGGGGGGGGGSVALGGGGAVVAKQCCVRSASAAKGVYSYTCTFTTQQSYARLLSIPRQLPLWRRLVCSKPSSQKFCLASSPLCSINNEAQKKILIKLSS